MKKNLNMVKLMFGKYNLKLQIFLYSEYGQHLTELISLSHGGTLCLEHVSITHVSLRASICDWILTDNDPELSLHCIPGIMNT